MKKVRLGLVGAGSMAKAHLSVIKAIDWLEPAGITSRTKSKAQQLAQEFGISACSDDLETLVREVKPDALLILVSEDQMEQVVRKALGFGLPLFIEKPAALSAAQNLELAQLAKERNIQSMVGLNRRYYSLFHKGLDIIHQHGRLLGIHVEGHERIWRQRAIESRKAILPVWPIVNSIHTIDLLRFFGGDVKEVQAQANSLREPVDQISATLRMNNNVLAQYESFWFSPGGWRVVLYGDGVTVEFKPLESGRWTDTDFKVHELVADSEDIQYKPGFYKQMIAFGKLVRDGIKEWPLADLYDAYKTMVLIEQVTANALPIREDRS